jgi:Glyoxalase-like domain
MTDRSPSGPHGNGPHGNGPLGLEHPLVVSHNLDVLAERYRAMGFAPTHKGHHPWGTGTQLVLFPDSFIELMGIEDRSLIDVPSAGGFRFGRFIAGQLDRREGIAMIALHSDDAKADLAMVTARGVRNDGLVDFRREVVLPDGTKDAAVVTLAMLIDRDQPQLSHFICQQHRPEFVWVPAWMQHPNGADAILRVVYAVAEPDAVRQRFAGLWGEAALLERKGGYSVTTPGGEVLVLDHASAQERLAPVPMPAGWRDAPCAVAITLRAPDLELVHRVMLRNGLSHQRLDGLVRVPPTHAGNVVLEFVS